MKMPDVDLSKESLQVQEAFDGVRSILNTGAFEVSTTASAPPASEAPQETKMFLSLYGTQYRLYISYLGAWYYVNLTKV